MMQIITAIQVKKKPITLPAAVLPKDSALSYVLHRCLSYDPNARPQVSEVLEVSPVIDAVVVDCLYHQLSSTVSDSNLQ